MQSKRVLLKDHIVLGMSRLFVGFLLSISIMSCGEEIQMDDPPPMLNFNFGREPDVYDKDDCTSTAKSTYNRLFEVSERGYVLSTDNTNPTIEDLKVVQEDDLIRGEITVPIDDVQLDFPANCRAYVIFEDEAYYSEPYVIDYKLDGNVQFERLSRFPSQGVVGATSFIINNWAYLCGGRIFTNGLAYSDRLWALELNDLNWKTTVELFPGGRRERMVSFVIDDIAYVGSGGGFPFEGPYNEFDDFYKFDPFTETWEEIAPIPLAGSSGVSFVLNGEGYVTGYSNQDSHRLFKYNPATDEWTEMNNNPFADQSDYSMAIAIDDKAYTFISEKESGSTTVHSYDASSDSWSEFITVPGDFQYGLVFEREGNMLLMTGRNTDCVVEIITETKQYRLMCIDPSLSRSEAVGFDYENQYIITSGNEGGGYRSQSTNSTYRINF